MAFFDTHAHLNLEPLSKKVEEIIKSCQKSDIFINIVGVDKNTSLLSVNLGEKFSNVWSSVGIHPGSINSICFDNLDNFFEQLLVINCSTKLVAIGETGLDYHYENFNSEEQKKYFIKHIEIAKKFKKTLIVHVRDAHDDVYEILKKYAQGVKTIIHCFSGDQNNAKKYLELGCYISFSGIVSFKNAAELREVVKIVPIDKILIETDCPWLAPVPFRGKENIPQYVKYVFKSIKELKDEKNLEKIIFENSLNAFGINKKDTM